MENSEISARSADNIMEIGVAALAERIARWTENGELHTTAVPGLSLFRRNEPTEPISGMYEPSICMAVQGAKRVILGEDTYMYDAHHYLITSVHLPTIVQIIEASPGKPYLDSASNSPIEGVSADTLPGLID